MPSLLLQAHAYATKYNTASYVTRCLLLPKVFFLPPPRRLNQEAFPWLSHDSTCSPLHGSCVLPQRQVSELEDQLGRARRQNLELVAYSTDENHTIFSAALKPECPICRAEIKEVVLNPCRHLAACSTCADTLPRFVCRVPWYSDWGEHSKQDHTTNLKPFTQSNMAGAIHSKGPPDLGTLPPSFPSMRILPQQQ